jgi:hypothetical protein
MARQDYREGPSLAVVCYPVDTPIERLKANDPQGVVCAMATRVCPTPWYVRSPILARNCDLETDMA